MFDNSTGISENFTYPLNETTPEWLPAFVSMSPLWQALCGGCFTWFMTALGAGVVFLYCSPKSNKLLDGSLGFAAGVMTAASVWSLLLPALDVAQSLHPNHYWVPVAGGLVLGAAFVCGADYALMCCGYGGQTLAEYMAPDQVSVEDGYSAPKEQDKLHETTSHRASIAERAIGWRRVTLLIIAIVVHNVPEGAAVGLAFSASAQPNGPSIQRALSLALGMGIQNMPEGMAVSLPLVGFGFSRWKAFMYGQLSGVVEPVAAVLGALSLVVLTQLLPWALSFAAGAMLYVVYEDVLPAGNSNGNGKLCSVCAMVGFVIMMCLDVLLG